MFSIYYFFEIQIEKENWNPVCFSCWSRDCLSFTLTIIIIMFQYFGRCTFILIEICQQYFFRFTIWKHLEKVTVNSRPQFKPVSIYISIKQYELLFCAPALFFSKIFFFKNDYSHKHFFVSETDMVQNQVLVSSKMSNEIAAIMHEYIVHVIFPSDILGYDEIKIRAIKIYFKRLYRRVQFLMKNLTVTKRLGDGVHKNILAYYGFTAPTLFYIFNRSNQ